MAHLLKSIEVIRIELYLASDEATFQRGEGRRFAEAASAPAPRSVPTVRVCADVRVRGGAWRACKGLTASLETKSDFEELRDRDKAKEAPP